MYDTLSGCLVVRGESISLVLGVCYVAQRIATGDIDPQFARENFLGLFSKLASEASSGQGPLGDGPGVWHIKVVQALES